MNVFSLFSHISLRHHVLVCSFDFFSILISNSGNLNDFTSSTVLLETCGLSVKNIEVLVICLLLSGLSLLVVPFLSLDFFF